MHPETALNADKKWSQNHGDLMPPDRAIAPPSFKKVLASAFLINFTLQ